MLFRTALVLGLCAAPLAPALAQEMPSWAAPDEIGPPPPNVDPDARVGPDLPPDPSPVPLDGLAWMALVGAGYAARRLRR